jgi:choline dehydrogenase-like flavoprotein
MATPDSAALHDIVSALAYALAAEQVDGSRPGCSGPYNDVTQFILRQHGRMSDPLRGPLALATQAFDWAGLVHGGRRFHRRSVGERLRQIQAWRESRISAQRDLVRFYESLVTLALHERTTAASPATSGPVAMGESVAVPSEWRCEIAVVGSGPGGSITACLLAEAGRDVLLIEEGEAAPLESAPAFSRTEMEQKYRNGGLTVALGPTKIAYVEGRVAGGGSEINSGLYHRTPPDVLEQWRREFQVAALTEADLQPHFEAIERDLSVSPLPGVAPAASTRLHDGATRLGWKSLEVPRWFRYDASAPGGIQGARQSMSRTYLPRFLRAGGRLLAGTRVMSLTRERSWILRATQAGRSVRIAADTVFACGGAVQTPALLRRSGITTAIGDSLRVHPTVKLVARFPDVVNAADMGVPVHQVKEFAPRISLGCSISSPAYLALGLIDHPAVRKTVADDWPHLANYYAMIAPEGRGTVRTLPGRRDPIVRFQLTPSDRRNLAEGLRRLGEAMFAAGASELYPALSGGLILRDPQALSHLPEVFPAGTGGLMTIHLFSACPMGERRDVCATDSFGRVFGQPGLRISDASLLCGAPGVNPQGTIMALVRRNALHFLGKL